MADGQNRLPFVFWWREWHKPLSFVLVICFHEAPLRFVSTRRPWQVHHDGLGMPDAIAETCAIVRAVCAPASFHKARA